jgi:hypothetical protein
MKTKENKLRPRFAPETRFALRPVPVAAPFRATLETEFERLKKELLARRLVATDTELNAPIRRAANEAAAIAWNTLFPLLVFPTLFEEKAEAALHHARRQARIYVASSEIATLAA